MRRACLALVFLSLPALLAGQTSPSSAPGEAPQAVFRSGVELVRLDVRVVDGQGRPVKDLRQDEIEVLEGGRSLPIVQFQHIAEPQGSYVEVARRTIGGEVSTNRGAPRGHLYLLVFDQQHISPGNEQKARQAAERFLRTRVRPGDRVALYALPGPGPQVPFTSNVDAVIDQLPTARGMLDRAAPGSVVAMSVFEAFEINRGDLNVLQRVVSRAAGTAADILARTPGSTSAVVNASGDSQSVVEQLVKSNALTAVDRADADTRAMLAMLADVMEGLEGIEGRKTVLFFSEGFLPDNVAREAQRVAAAAAKSYSVFYAFDLNQRGVDVGGAQPQGGEAQAEIQSRMESIGSLASDTDGQLIVDARSHLDAAFSRLADQSQDYYLVAFEPPPEAVANRSAYRLVKVRVRRPGVEVSTRTGYALRDPISAADRRRAIDLALRAPFPQQALPLEATTYAMGEPASGRARVILCVQADLPVASGRQPGEADVVFVARSTADGRVVASGTGAMPLPVEVAPGRTSGQAGYRVQFDAPPGDYLMRVVVREPGGTTGSVDRRFDVQDFDGTDVTASDLVLGRGPDGGLPVRATGYTGTGLSGVFEIYARRPSDLEAVDARASLTPLGGTTPLTSVQADLLEVQPSGGGSSRGAQVSLPLNGVPPGPYLVTVNVRSHGETAAELMREVDVVAGTAPVPAPAPAPVPPTAREILAGDLARQYIATLRKGSGDRAIIAAADEAGRGEWAKVPALLGPPGFDPSPAFHALMGLAWFAEERYDQAAAALQAAFDLDERSALTAFFLGWARARAGDDTGAVTAWRAAAVLQPQLVPAYLALADMYVRLSHRDLALQVLRDGLAKVQQSPELREKLQEVERRSSGL